MSNDINTTTEVSLFVFDENETPIGKQQMFLTCTPALIDTDWPAPTLRELLEWMVDTYYQIRAAVEANKAWEAKQKRQDRTTRPGG